MAIRLNIGLVIISAYLFSDPSAASAFQSHPGPEGLYAHQLAHIFFILAMAFLAYWLQVNGFIRQRGWRLIQISCILLILWNIVAFTGHWVEEGIADAAISGEADWTQRIVVNSVWTALYYAFKLDHIVQVPAIVCLVLGMRSLYKHAAGEQSGDT
jgi:hypothetical protein